MRKVREVEIPKVMVTDDAMITDAKIQCHGKGDFKPVQLELGKHELVVLSPKGSHEFVRLQLDEMQALHTPKSVRTGHIFSLRVDMTQEPKTGYSEWRAKKYIFSFQCAAELKCWQAAICKKKDEAEFDPRRGISICISQPIDLPVPSEKQEVYATAQPPRLPPVDVFRSGPNEKYERGELAMGESMSLDKHSELIKPHRDGNPISVPPFSGDKAADDNATSFDIRQPPLAPQALALEGELEDSFTDSKKSSVLVKALSFNKKSRYSNLTKLNEC